MLGTGALCLVPAEWDRQQVPAIGPSGVSAGQRRILCSRCGKPITGKHWKTVTGRVLHSECTQGSTYISDQLQNVAPHETPAPPDDGPAARGWRRLMLRGE